MWSELVTSARNNYVWLFFSITSPDRTFLNFVVPKKVDWLINFMNVHRSITALIDVRLNQPGSHQFQQHKESQLLDMQKMVIILITICHRVNTMVCRYQALIIVVVALQAPEIDSRQLLNVNYRCVRTDTATTSNVARPVCICRQFFLSIDWIYSQKKNISSIYSVFTF